jgi:glycosyltransferase involved in cell wall biosynthesis
LGWVNDDMLLRDFTAASDIFLMPSIAEAFGVMAIEAMASSVPVIVFEDTALPETTYSPEAGITVPSKNYIALRDAIQNLINFPQERDRRGSAGRRIAELQYGEEKFVKNLAELYFKKLKN